MTKKFLIAIILTTLSLATHPLWASSPTNAFCDDDEGVIFCWEVVANKPIKIVEHLDTGGDATNSIYLDKIHISTKYMPNSYPTNSSFENGLYVTITDLYTEEVLFDGWLQHRALLDCNPSQCYKVWYWL